MADKFSPTQIHQLRQVISDVLDEKLDIKLDEKLGENYKARFDRIENNTDMACKIAKDTREELTLTQTKVDRHDGEIKELQSFAGFATT